MKLTSLTRADLGDLQDALSHIAKAADVLFDGGFDPVISLSDTETRLTTSAILGEGGDLPAIEVDEPRVEIEIVPPLAVEVPETVMAVPPHSVPEQGETLVEPKSSPLIPGGIWSERIRGDDGLWRGPWLPSEDTVVIEMRGRGHTYRTIGEALERSKAAVAFRANNALSPDIIAAAKALKSEGVSTRSAPGKPPVEEVADVRAVTSRPAPAESIGSAEAATGGDLIQNSEAVRAPQSAATDTGPRDAAPVEGSHAPAGSGPAPAVSNGTHPPAVPPQGVAKKSNGWGECPADLSADARALWHDLAWLKPDPVFDINLDLDLCNGLARGRPLGELALELDVDAAVAKARFAHLTATIRNEKGVITLAGQAALLSVLKRRAGVPA